MMISAIMISALQLMLISKNIVLIVLLEYTDLLQFYKVVYLSGPEPTSLAFAMQLY